MMAEPCLSLSENCERLKSNVLEARVKARGASPSVRPQARCYPATGSVDAPAVAPADCPAGLPNSGPRHANTRYAGSEWAAA